MLIGTPGLSEEKKADIEKLKFRFNSIIDSRGLKYVLMNLLKERIEEAVAILPGMKSPTLLPLADENW